MECHKGARFTKKHTTVSGYTKHPTRGLMRYVNGWLSEVEDKQIKFNPEDKMIPYHDKMRIKGESYKNKGSYKIKKRCSECGKKTAESFLIEGMCPRCYEAKQDLELELKQLRHAFKWGSQNSAGNTYRNMEGA